MKRSARLLQERLERLEAGEGLEACLADLSEEEAALLKTAVALREVEFPERDSGVVAAQRAETLELAAGVHGAKHKSSPESSPQLKRLLPLAVGVGGVALLSICILIAVIGGGFAWRSIQEIRVAQKPSPSPTSVVVAQKPSPSPTSEVLAPTPSPSPVLASEATPTQDLSPEPPKEPTYNVFVPMVVLPEIRDPRTAVLKDPQGVVQVQTGSDTWVTVSTRHHVAAGQRVRTGALSSAEIAFYDGSWAHLGPNTEVSVDELNARASGGPRVVALTQWVGETDHDVVPSAQTGSRYEVRTPSGTGVATGTSFHVLVTVAQLSRFSVDEGSVAVTGLDVTVIIVAGQSTTIIAGQPPGEPVFRITGQGEVTEKGETWTIAGQIFETDDDTMVIGNPQVGDWVFVEGRLFPDGTRLADRIVLLHRAPENRFTIIGRAEAISDTVWTVAGQVVVVDDGTEIEEGIEIDDLVRVEGVIQEGGTLLAEDIRLVEEEPGWPFHFVGVVQEQDTVSETWTISGVTVAVTDTTEIDDGLLVGDVVEVRGWILDDGTWLARSIKRFVEGERWFEFTGYVESIDPWEVSGLAIDTEDWTEIEDDIEVGDRVKVEGYILEDGSRLAYEIKRVDDDDEALYFEFVGTVTSKDPWIVSGILLDVDDETEVEDDIEVGDLVKVEGQILADPDVRWLAREIKRVDLEPGLGCFSFSVVVVGIDGGRLILADGQTVDLGDGVVVEGDLEVGAVILIFVCVDADGTVTVVSVIVIFHPGPIIFPPPPPPPGDGDKLTICHYPSGNPDAAHTIVIDRSALESHLEHGDTIGPCPVADDDDDNDDDDDDDGRHSQDRVVICHRHQGESGDRETMIVEWAAWLNEHSRHGDTLGPCPDD